MCKPAQGDAFQTPLKHSAHPLKLEAHIPLITYPPNREAILGILQHGSFGAFVLENKMFTDSLL